MKIELETNEIKAIAAAVAEILAPRLSALEAAVSKAIAAGQAKPQATSASQSIAAIQAGDAMISLAEVKRLTGLSSSTIWRRHQDGSFPPKRRLSTRRVGWLRAEVDAYRRGQWVA
jgi:prophage regulatory protein